MENFDLKKLADLASKIQNNNDKSKLSLDELIELKKNETALTDAIKYAKSCIYALVDSRYLIFINGKTEIYPSQMFENAYGKRIKKINKAVYEALTDGNTDLYVLDVYNENFIVDNEKRRINMKHQPKITYKQYEPTREERQCVKKILRYIKDVICSGIEEQYEFLFDWMSICLRGERTNCILVLYTLLEGTGKSKFMELLQCLFGNAMTGITRNQLSGSDAFNSNLIGKTMIYLEETIEQSANADKNVGMQFLKQLSTSARFAYRGMQKEAVDYYSFANIGISTNNKVDAGRRAFVPTIDTSRLEDREYYGEITACMKNEGAMQHLFNKLVKREITFAEFNCKPIPKSEGFISDQKDAMKQVWKYIADRYIYEENPKKQIKRSELYEDFKIWHSTILKSDAKYLTAKGTVFQAMREMQFKEIQDQNGIKCFRMTDYTEKFLKHAFTDVKQWVTEDDLLEYKYEQNKIKEEGETIYEKKEEVKKEEKEGEKKEKKIKKVEPTVEEIFEIEKKYIPKKIEKIEREAVKKGFDTLENSLW